MSERQRVIENLTSEERKKVVDMLAKMIIERRKEQERLDGLKKI